MPTLTFTNITTGATGHTSGARGTVVVDGDTAYIADGNEMLRYDYGDDAAITLGIEAYTDTTLSVSAGADGSLTIATGDSVWIKATYHDDDKDVYGNPGSPVELAGDGAARQIIVANIVANADTRIDRVMLWMTVPMPADTPPAAREYFLVSEAVDTTTSQTINLSLDEIQASSRLVLDVSGIGARRSHDKPRRGTYLVKWDGNYWLAGCVKNNAGNADAKPHHVYMTANPEYWDDANSMTFPEEVTALWPQITGLLVFTVSRTYMITGTGTVISDYRWTLLSEKSGCVSHWSLRNRESDDGSSHPIWLSRAGFMALLGGNIVNLTKRRLTWFDEGAGKWAQNYMQYAPGHYNRQNGYYFCAIPEAAQTVPSTELVLNDLTNGFEVWDRNVTPQWYGSYENQDQEEVGIFSDADGWIYYETPTTYTDAGTAIDMDYESQKTDWGADGRVKTLANIEMEFDPDGTDATSVSVQVYEEWDATAKPATAVSLATDSFSSGVGISAGGRCMSIRVRENTNSKKVRVSKIAMDARPLALMRV